MNITGFNRDSVSHMDTKFQSNGAIGNGLNDKNIDFSAIFELISFTNQWLINTSCWWIGVIFTMFIQLTMLYSMMWGTSAQVFKKCAKILAKCFTPLIWTLFCHLHKRHPYQWIEHCQLYKHGKFHSNLSTGSID